MDPTQSDEAEALERKRIEALASEGYIATRDDRDGLAKVWEVVDLKGWPD